MVQILEVDPNFLTYDYVKVSNTGKWLFFVTRDTLPYMNNISVYCYPKFIFENETVKRIQYREYSCFTSGTTDIETFATENFIGFGEILFSTHCCQSLHLCNTLILNKWYPINSYMFVNSKGILLSLSEITQQTTSEDGDTVFWARTTAF